MPLNFLSYQTTFLPFKIENFKFSDLSGKLSAKQITPNLFYGRIIKITEFHIIMFIKVTELYIYIK